MSLSVEQHGDTTFTVTFNDSDNIYTTVTASGDDVDEWIDQILRIHRRRLNRLVVGLDAEWRPSFSPTQNPVAVLQLCVGRRCLLFLILHADYVPASLSDFLADDRFTFVGVGIDGDADRLDDEQNLQIANAVDLRTLAADRMGRRGLKNAGLALLAAQVMGVNVWKPKRVTMSHWDRRYLTYEQISYACSDAFISFEIGRRLFAGEF
ncbi:hypothetical protein OPV22_001078 [Ensete ventricosum]|uniref:PH domain-containing protein n=1 Tax=Ensete ventricosum TaxID=4639 RepID=A0AAV8RV77_ENSVE|nr:hypothetical protein OPV22_001078 [Ensete ventricosum]